MSRLIVQSFVWNAAQFIAAPLLALHEFVDEIQIFDGAWDFMRKSGYAKVPWSTDGTEQVVKSLKLKCPVKWISCRKFYESQVAKKTFMLKYWKPGEWVYFMADDEVPVGNIQKAFEKVRNAPPKILIGYVPRIRVKPFPLQKPGVFRRSHLKGTGPRFFKWQKGFHYGKTHNIILDAKNVFRDKWPRIILNEMLIVHLKWLRHLERREAQSAYQKTKH